MYIILAVLSVCVVNADNDMGSDRCIGDSQKIIESYRVESKLRFQLRQCAQHGEVP